MIRKTAAILIALTSLVALGACSSSGDSKSADETTTTTVTSTSTSTGGDGDATTTTAEDGGTAAVEGDGEIVPSTIDLGGLAASSGGTLTAENQACVAQGVAEDPTVSDYASYADLQRAPLINRTAFYSILLDCVGFDTVVDLYMQRYSESNGGNETQLSCARSTVESMAAEDGVALLAGDETTISMVSDLIATECVTE